MLGDYDLVERNIGDLLQILSRMVTELFSKATLGETTPHQLSQPQLSMLTLLDAVGRQKISDLCRVHHISAPAGTKNVDKLESLGLMKRVCPHDSQPPLRGQHSQARATIKGRECPHRES